MTTIQLLACCHLPFWSVFRFFNESLLKTLENGRRFWKWCVLDLHCAHADMSHGECDLHTKLSRVTPPRSGQRRNRPSSSVEDYWEEEFSSNKCCHRILFLFLVFLFYSSIFYLGVMGQLNLGNLIPLSRLAYSESAAYEEGREEEVAGAFERRFGTGRGQIPQDHPELISMIRTLYLYPPPPDFPQSPPQSRPHHGHQGQNSTQLSNFVRHVYRNKTKGFFVEYPASNGVSDSGNSDLEQNLRWNGLLIEPLPTLALQALRLSRNVWISDACLSTIRQLHKTPFHGHPFPLVQNGSESVSRSTVVQCVPLYSLLLAVNITPVHCQIDYLYLNNREAEYKILRVIPYDLVRIGVIVIRNWKPSPTSQSLRFLESRDYVRVPGRFPEFLVLVHASLEGFLPDT